jgi:acetyltransferase-like isoleucine patch superfamily enzyme
MRRVLPILLIVLPQSLKRLVGRRLLGWDIHPTARIGRSLVSVRHLSMGPGSLIGSFNVIKQLDELRLGEGASIASRNHIIGFPLGSPVFQKSPNRTPSLVLGKYAQITVGHELDCCDLIEVGDYSAVAGFRSAIMTHNLDLVRDRFMAAPVRIGERSAVMSGCTILSGTGVPARSIISAGSVVTTRLVDELTVYRGNPAEAVRTLPDTLAFFHRGEDGAANAPLGV